MVHDTHAAVTSAVQHLAAVARRIGSSLALDETLEAVATAVVDTLGFRAAVVNLLGPDDELHVVAIAGGDAIRAALEGTHSSRATWEDMLAAASPWGQLRFLSHSAPLPQSATAMTMFVPDVADALDSPEEQRWHPEDALFAPLVDVHGDLLGVLSVDDPVDGELPGPIQRGMLEAFAMHAALAIDHARAHDQLASSELLLRRMFDESPIGKALFDADSRYVRVNQAYCEFMGRAADEFIGHRVIEFTHPDEQDSTTALSTQIRSGDVRAARTEKRYLRSDGTERWGRLTLTRIEDGDQTSVLAAIEDITDIKTAEHQLRHLALHDSLTGLPNRTLIFDRLDQALARSRRDGTSVAVMVIDVDHFKQVNDAYGHPVGDRLLLSVAETLRTTVRDSDTAGRLGGDEFVLVCEGINAADDVAAMVARLCSAVRVPVDAGEVTVLPSASIGCTIGSAASTADQLIAEADAALYRAKAAGRGRWEMFDEAMRGAHGSRAGLHAQLVDALARGEFRLHYQPLVDIVDGTTIGFEALIRWEHPTRGLLTPAEFLEAVVDSDLDVPVTQWVLTQACADAARIAASCEGTAVPFVSVNLSARQLGRADLVDDVAAALVSSGVSADRLWLEITEEHAIDTRHRAVLQRLRGLGCAVALDDFGTGYSGLTYLQQLPIDVLKIDGSFVAKLEQDPMSRAITSAVTYLAAALGVTLVAEGIETEEQAELLRTMGVGLGQGYHLGRPASIDAALTREDNVRRLPSQRGPRPSAVQA